MNKVLKEILSTSLYLLVVLCLTYLFITFIGQRTQVSGSSMESTLSDKDNLIVDKITYRFKDPQRFDIIVFPVDEQQDTYYIKRVIGLPGESVYIDTKGDIYIDDVLLEESYGNAVIADAGRAAGTVVLEEDEYFVMGDNRNNSIDSRMESVGNVHKDDIIGKAWIRIWPIRKFGILKHQ